MVISAYLKAKMERELGTVNKWQFSVLEKIPSPSPENAANYR
jgi:hypothetical protein